MGKVARCAICGKSCEKWEIVVKSWRKVGKGGEKWEKVPKSGEKWRKV